MNRARLNLEVSWVAARGLSAGTDFNNWMKGESERLNLSLPIHAVHCLLPVGESAETFPNVIHMQSF